MIQSMTGFGKSLLQLPTKKITVEIKSLNSKTLDLNARIPGQFREKELHLRNIISNSLTRGKVDFTLYIEVTAGETTSVVSPAVVKNYIQQLKEIVDGDETELLKMAVRMPDALKTEREEIDETEFASIEEAVHSALKEINQFRADEGKALEAELDLRVTNIGNLLEEIIAMDPD